MAEPASKIIDIHRGSASESRLVVYADGRIMHHVENEGYRYLHHGAEARDEWVSLDHVKAYWPQVVDQIEAAIVELGRNLIRSKEEDMFFDDHAPPISASGDQLLKQATMTAHDYMLNARMDVDEQFGEGTAYEHPELVAAHMQVQALDLGAAIISQQVRCGLDLLAETNARLANAVERLVAALPPIAPSVEAPVQEDLPF